MTTPSIRIATKTRKREKDSIGFVLSCFRGFLVAASITGVTLLAQQPPDRARPPQPGPPPPLSLPAIQKEKLSNGLPVWVVELHEVPVAQVNLLIFSGSSSEPGRKFGIASLTTAMLEQGAGSRSALEIADAVDYLGADLSAGCILLKTFGEQFDDLLHFGLLLAGVAHFGDDLTGRGHGCPERIKFTVLGKHLLSEGDQHV